MSESLPYVIPPLPTPPLVEDPALQIWIHSVQQAMQNIRTGLQVVSLDPSDALITINSAATSGLGAVGWTEWVVGDDLNIPFNAQALILDGSALRDNNSTNLHGICFVSKKTNTIWSATGDVSSVTTYDGNTKVTTPLGVLSLWSDVFGDILDTAHWVEEEFGYAEPDTFSVTKVGGKLHIIAEDTGAGAKGEQSILTFPGDFDIEVEFDITHGAGTNSWAVFQARKDGDDNNNRFMVRKRLDPEQIEALTVVASASTNSTFATTVDSGKFRLVRSGTTLECYYDIGGGWVKLHDYTGATSIGTLKIELFLIVSANTSTLDFNSFTQNSGGVYWNDNPEIILEQKDLKEIETIDMSSIAVVSSGSGSLKYQYATDEAGTTWNGSWLTLTQLQAITDMDSRYFRIKAQLISDGTQDVILTSVAFDHFKSARSWLYALRYARWATRTLILPLYDNKMFYKVIAPDANIDVELKRIGWITELI